eukprot:CAMPEP_0173127532 /NCGR_PEP_ID=MMETSP1102-20130122/57875_1 /TAXON_ID=49646 /ORGANISM="Geminigera sp., Strain Caron Lab Isolate" /LENGTH=113 /DNA_ID=CAMNT_0014037223 /DNA_START=643 /DNA_END=984 /DNA_ORIENTATION=+
MCCMLSGGPLREVVWRVIRGDVARGIRASGERATEGERLSLRPLVGPCPGPCHLYVEELVESGNDLTVRDDIFVEEGGRRESTSRIASLPSISPCCCHPATSSPVSVTLFLVA